MSDIIKTAGDGANMTPWDYIAMIDRIRKGDYSDLPRIFCVAPSKLIPEMSIEELIEHRHLMENAIRFLRTMVNVVVVQENSIKAEMSEEESQRCMEYEVKHAPKARAAIAEREKAIKAEDSLVAEFMASGMSRAAAVALVADMKSDDGKEEEMK